MMKRRGFFGKLAALVGLLAWPIRTKANSCLPYAGPDGTGWTFQEGPPVNMGQLLSYPAGTLKLGKPVPGPKGGWTVPFEYRAEGWEDETDEAKP